MSPWLQLEMKKPVKNKVCGHTYEEEAIVRMIESKHKRKKKAWWVAAGREVTPSQRWSVRGGAFTLEEKAFKLLPWSPFSRRDRVNMEKQDMREQISNQEETKGASTTPSEHEKKELDVMLIIR